MTHHAAKPLDLNLAPRQGELNDLELETVAAGADKSDLLALSMGGGLPLRTFPMMSFPQITIPNFFGS